MHHNPSDVRALAALLDEFPSGAARIKRAIAAQAARAKAKEACRG